MLIFKQIKLIQINKNTFFSTNLLTQYIGNIVKDQFKQTRGQYKYEGNKKKGIYSIMTIRNKNRFSQDVRTRIKEE